MNNKFLNIVICILMFSLAITTICLYTFFFRWVITTEIYEDVDYEWDDDHDRYEVAIDDLGYFFIATNKATLVFLPDDPTLNAAIIKKSETILGKDTTYTLVKFYLNVGWKEELL